MRNGWITVKPDPETRLAQRTQEREEDMPKYYAIWGDQSESDRNRSILAAPKQKPPSHAESYNPPAEYLMSEDEKKRWEEQEPYQRKLSFIPQK